MTTTTIINAVLLFFIWTAIAFDILWVRYLSKRVNDLEQRIDEIELKRLHVYEAMADVNMIEDEMERGARLREMKDAHRTTLPREDAVGQNARVFRPKLRAKEPSRWNPPGPQEREE